MDHFRKLVRQVRTYLFVCFIITNAVAIGLTVFVLNQSFVPTFVGFAAVVLLVLAVSALVAHKVSGYLLEPLHYLWQAILHVSPEHQGEPAPDLEQARLGRELVTSLSLQVYQFASQQNSTDLIEHRQAIIQAANIVSHMPIPLFVFNKDQVVTNASNLAMEYCQIESANLFGKPLYESLNMEFRSESTLEKWLTDSQTDKLTNTAYWERVRVILPDQTIRQCDIAALYDRDNPSGTEFIVTLFDRTALYNQEDESVNFISLAVHELRTPLTMLRGYIEVFEDELAGKLDEELTGFMRKMQVSANQLTSFVNNMLNVARIENNQMSLNLSESTWAEVVNQAVNDAQLRAKVNNRQITVTVAPNLPTVGVDQVSIYEVISNLLENAIKYSSENSVIKLSTQLSRDGLVETTVHNDGPAIPLSILPNLFEKFYRNHRTRAQVGGTGLGLYLCKAIVTAHGGQIWANSREGEGTTFGFTVVPFANLAAEQKNSDNTGIVRYAHGWIKNHSLYRR